MADLILQLAGFLVAAGAVYGGIRSDLAAMRENIRRNERAVEKLHARLDECGICRGRRHDD